MLNRVSIIIPTYNYAQFVTQSVASAINQKIDDVEVIVVDDGSTDNTKYVLTPYLSKIKYIYQKNAGLSAARNTGIKASSGEFIQFLDADDLLGKDSILHRLQFLKKNPDITVTVCRNSLFTETTKNGYPKPIFTKSWPLYKNHLDVHLCYFNIAPPHAFLCRRSAILASGWFDTQLKACEDYDFWLRAAIAGHLPHYCPKGLVYYRRHAESMSANLANQYRFDVILHRRLYDILKKYPGFPPDNPLEGRLAFLAGTLKTVQHLNISNIAEVDDLLKICVAVSADIRHLSEQFQGSWNILTRLYYVRILEVFRVLFLSQDIDYKVKITKNLYHTLQNLNAPSTALKLITDALYTSLFYSQGNFLERIRLAKFALRYSGFHLTKKL